MCHLSPAPRNGGTLRVCERKGGRHGVAFVTRRAPSAERDRAAHGRNPNPVSRVCRAMKTMLAATALALTLAACSAEAPPDEATTSPDVTAAAPGDDATDPAPDATSTAAADRTMTLEGLGALKLGQPVPAGSGWTKPDVQASDTCLVYRSASYPGVYAIVEEGAVRRISAGSGSDVRFVEGIRVGSTRAQVDGSFPGFSETPHKYVEGGVDLTAPNASSGDPAVRFELDATGKVTEMHVGTEPVLGYVEGCA